MLRVENRVKTVIFETLRTAEWDLRPRQTRGSEDLRHELLELDLEGKGLRTLSGNNSGTLVRTRAYSPKDNDNFSLSYRIAVYNSRNMIYYNRFEIEP